MSLRSSTLVVAAAAAIVVPAASAAGAQTVTISHETKGCHMWQLGNGAPKVNLSVTIKRGATLRFVNNDIMPQRLIQQSGAKLTLTHANMNRMSASTSVKFPRDGTYRFTTKAGEDYPWMKAMGKTIGPDNVLHLTVRVQ
jgi:plastocyanin